MDEDVDRLLGHAWRDGPAWEVLTHLTELGDRLGGHPGERRAADHMADALDAAGGDPRIESFEMQRWMRGTADLAVHHPRGVERTFEAVALPYSPPGNVHAPLVDVGYGTPDELDEVDVTGSVVVASTTTPGGQRFVHRMEKFGHAIAAGAEAFVFANHVPGQLPPTGALRFNAEAAAPGVGVSRETGDWLTDYADDGAEVDLRVEAVTEPGQSQNVLAEFGPDTEEIVVLLAHYDAHDVAEGALDNGCGVAVTVAAAGLLADLDLDRRVLVAGVGCEELGLMGSEALAADLDLDRVACAVNVDGAGRFRDLTAYTHGHDTLRDVAERIVEGVGQPLAVEETPHPYSDHWPFLRAGVPALQLHSRPAKTATTGAHPDERGRGWGHTRADTRDKVDRRNLREHAMLTALLVRELAGIDLERVDETELAERLRESDAEAGMRAADIWPADWT